MQTTLYPKVLLDNHNIFILTKNKIKCVYASIINYYKFNFYIDNNTFI